MFIEEYPGLITPELCEQIIARFEADPRRSPSVTVVEGYSTLADRRLGMSLPCEPVSEWQDVFNVVVPALHTALNRYAEKYKAMRRLIDTEGLVCTAPIIERVDPGQGFDWHYDQTSYSWERVLTAIIYLRTVVEGGATEFAQQAYNVRPEAGKMALFPGAWTHLHRGASPVSGTKYCMTSFWIYAKRGAQ